jgi:hypothetical protein
VFVREGSPLKEEYETVAGQGTPGSSVVAFTVLPGLRAQGTYYLPPKVWVVPTEATAREAGRQGVGKPPAVAPNSPAAEDREGTESHADGRADPTAS